MLSLYPLRFEPLLRRYIWGGRKLGMLLGKPIGEESDYAESWEVVDRGADQSCVAFGPLAGTTLGELMRTGGAELLGLHHPQAGFPLLFKFLDCERTLSVQVHPTDAQAAQLHPPDLGKTEAWVVLEAEPGSVIYAGLKRGFDRAALEREVQRGTCELCLHRLEPRPGDCLFLPAGAVHALGAGLVIAEIQQSSDATFRLFDWNRLDADGRPRPLHIEQALAAIDYSLGPLHLQQPQPTEQAHVQRLVACEKFVLDRWRLTQPQSIGGDGRFHLLAVLEGDLQIAGDPAPQPAEHGQTWLLPAALGKCELIPVRSATLLDIYLP
ncbi:MAG TPA: type I phosphomannose isomerase catalytic subunit [Pirellulales bacterium]|jgi:mannose-6-phosphate isomerase|nr:type I phosphomannose isomerase catalytic subunit [Pirellulales bacterium]